MGTTTKRRPRFVNHARKLWDAERRLWLSSPGGVEPRPARPREVQLSLDAICKINGLLRDSTKRGSLPTALPLGQAVEHVVQAWDDEGIAGSHR